MSASDESNDILNCKIAEYSLAVLKDRPHFHVSLVIDVSPNCDCHAENDIPIVPDVGMFASFDPVALDRACADAVNRQPVIADSQLDRMPMYIMTILPIPRQRRTGKAAWSMRRRSASAPRNMS